MKMSTRPGNLLYQSRGYKLKNGYADLPQAIKDFVSKNFPEYEHAPATFTAPNMTSWKYYKKVMEERKKKNG
jgi:type IV secretory pathway VirD2 relaxase